MSKAKKSTKNFARKKLKGASKHGKRHSHAHKGSGQQGHAGKAAAKAAENAPDKQKQKQKEKKPGAHSLADMDLDEFLDGGFEQVVEVHSNKDGQPLPLLKQQQQQSGSDQDLLKDSMGSADDLDLDDLDPGSSEDEQPGSAAAGSNEEDHGSSGDDDAAAAAAAAAAAVPEAAAVAADNAQLKGAISRHKQQLEALKAKDPDFYAYLQATDAGLLGFGEGEDEDDDISDLSASSSSDDDGEDDEREQHDQPQLQPAKQQATATDQRSTAAAATHGNDGQDDDQDPGGDQAAAAGVRVSSSMVDGWCQAAVDKASMGAMLQLIKAYRVACHYSDSEQQMTSTLTISSGAVFNKVMLFMLREADGIFRRMLGLQQDASSAAGGGGGGGGVLLAETVTKAPRWRKVEPLVKSYLGNSLHLLSSMAQPVMTAYTLRRLRPSAAFLGPYPRLTKKLLKLALELFGSGEKETAPRLQALLLVRQMGLVLPPPALQTSLRGAYRAYSANAKFVSPASLPALAFMAAGVTELSTLDLTVTYQVGFVAVRELAVLLRNALSQKTQDAHKEVYCWQTLNCLELWVKVFSAAAAKGSTLQPLIYPLSQLLLGAARLVPTPRYFPIRLRLVRALNRLAQASGVYIPVSPLLLEMLHWSELKRTPTGGAGAAPDMLLLLRLSKTQLKMASLQEEVVNQVLELLADHLRQWSTSIAFPEASHLPIVALRGFIKGCAVERFRRSAKQLVDAIERNVAYVGNARDNVTFAPQDLAAAGRFLADEKDVAKAPLVQFATQRLQKAAARMAMRSEAATQTLKVGSPGGHSSKNSSSKRQRAAQEDDSGVNEQQEQAGNLGDLMAAGAISDDLQSEDVIAGAAKRHIRQKEKQLKRAAAATVKDNAINGVGDAGADEIADYQLSDEDEDEDGKGVSAIVSDFDNMGSDEGAVGTRRGRYSSGGASLGKESKASQQHLQQKGRGSHRTDRAGGTHRQKGGKGHKTGQQKYKR